MIYDILKPYIGQKEAQDQILNTTHRDALSKLKAAALEQANDRAADVINDMRGIEDIGYIDDDIREIARGQVGDMSGEDACEGLRDNACDFEACLSEFGIEGAKDSRGTPDIQRLINAASEYQAEGEACEDKEIILFYLMADYVGAKLGSEYSKYYSKSIIEIWEAIAETASTTTADGGGDIIKELDEYLGFNDDEEDSEE